MMDTFGMNIVNARKKCGLAQKELAEHLGISATRLNYWEKDKRKPDIHMTNRIAEVLGISIDELIGNKQSNNDTTYFLEQKLAQIGYSIGGIESEGYLWINYPDGTLEVTETDLKELDQSTSSYLKFRLEELKEMNKKDFRKK